MIASIVFSVLGVGFIVWAETSRQVSQLMRVDGNLHYRAYKFDLVIIQRHSEFIFSPISGYFQSISSSSPLFLVQFGYFQTIFRNIPRFIFSPIFRKPALLAGFSSIFQLLRVTETAIFRRFLVQYTRIFRLRLVLFLDLFLDQIGFQISISYYNKVNKKEG